MANNYLEFSEELVCVRQVERQWLEEQMEEVYVFGDPEKPEEWRIVADEEDEEPEEAEDCLGLCPRFLVDFPGLWESGWEYAGFQYQFDSDSMWIYAEESGDVERVVHLVQKFIRQFELDGFYWSLTWATHCSKPRIGEFGGGGVVVSMNQVHWFGAHHAVERKIDELMKLGEYDVWSDHPRHPRSEWQMEVAANNTNRGYWDWVLAQIERVKDD